MPDANKDAERLAQLEAEVAALKAKQPKPQPSFEEMDRAAREYASQMHAMRERNASAIPPWMREACAGGVTDADAKDLVRASHRPQGPSTQSPQDFGKVRTRPARPPGGGTGWLEPTPLSPPPGVAQADRLMDAQDAKDRQQRMIEEARRREYEAQIDQEAKLRLAMKGRE